MKENVRNGYNKTTKKIEIANKIEQHLFFNSSICFSLFFMECNQNFDTL